MFSKQKYFRLKKCIFGNIFTFVSETLRKTNRKNHISFAVVAHARGQHRI